MDPSTRNDAVQRRADLRARGVSADRVQAQLDANRWRRLSPGVLVTHNGPLTRGQLLRAAVLVSSSPEGRAGLAAWSALELLGLHGWLREQVHVVVPRGRRTVHVDRVLVVVHESRRLRAVDLRRTSGIPTTSAARAAVDAAAWATSSRSAAGVLAATVQQRLATAAQLWAAVEAAGQVRRVAVLRKVVVDLAGGAEALSELDFLRFCRRHGFPEPVLQRRRKDAAGRIRYLDATFVRSSGRLLRVEVDGSVHDPVLAGWNDKMRQNDLVNSGERVLHFPSWAVYADDPDVVRQLRSGLAA